MEALRNWIMVVLTLIFVLLYTVVLLGWLKPLSEVTIITRLEPLIFIIMGYYFGRLPAQQNEQTLKGEINRLTTKAETAQRSREQTEKQQEVLEERLKIAKTILQKSSAKKITAGSLKPDNENNSETLQQTIMTAVNILNS